MNTIRCPKCQEPVEITEALKHQIEEQILQQVTSKHKDELEKIKTEADTIITKRILEVQEEAKKKAREEMESQFKNSQSELEEIKERFKKKQNTELELMKQLRQLKDKDQEREVEMQKKLLDERGRLQEEISKTERERSNLEKLELRKQLDDTKKALEEAQRKAEQRSQQLQGEVMELDLESQLTEYFPTDEILPVPKGIEGADIWQKVRNKHGQTAGSILWELKRTKAWNNNWATKLRENIRQIGASTAMLVSDILPEGVDKFGRYHNIWVTSTKYAIPLACVLRDGILQVAIAKSVAAHKDEKLDLLYSYITDDGFRHRFEAQVESIIELGTDLESEQRSTIRQWKKREIQIKRMKTNLSSMYGELQGILGTALPTIQSLDSAQLPTTEAQTMLLEE